jgi:hypothetical protein
MGGWLGLLCGSSCGAASRLEHLSSLLYISEIRLEHLSRYAVAMNLLKNTRQLMAWLIGGASKAMHSPGPNAPCWPAAQAVQRIGLLQ